MQPNPVVWFEIYVSDLQRARNFYETLFDRDTLVITFRRGGFQER